MGVRACMHVCVCTHRLASILSLRLPPHPSVAWTPEHGALGISHMFMGRGSCLFPFQVDVDRCYVHFPHCLLLGMDACPHLNLPLFTLACRTCGALARQARGVERRAAPRNPLVNPTSHPPNPLSLRQLPQTHLWNLKAENAELEGPPRPASENQLVRSPGPRPGLTLRTQHAPWRQGTRGGIFLLGQWAKGQSQRHYTFHRLVPFFSLMCPPRESEGMEISTLHRAVLPVAVSVLGHSLFKSPAFWRAGAATIRPPVYTTASGNTGLSTSQYCLYRCCCSVRGTKLKPPPLLLPLAKDENINFPISFLNLQEKSL